MTTNQTLDDALLSQHLFVGGEFVDGGGSAVWHRITPEWCCVNDTSVFSGRKVLIHRKRHLNDAERLGFLVAVPFVLFDPSASLGQRL